MSTFKPGDIVSCPACSASNCNNISTADGLQLLYCNRCKAARYCSKECQKRDWKQQHKQDCISPQDFVTLRDEADTELAKGTNAISYVQTCNPSNGQRPWMITGPIPRQHVVHFLADYVQTGNSTVKSNAFLHIILNHTGGPEAIEELRVPPLDGQSMRFHIHYHQNPEVVAGWQKNDGKPIPVWMVHVTNKPKAVGVGSDGEDSPRPASSDSGRGEIIRAYTSLQGANEGVREVLETWKAEFPEPTYSVASQIQPSGSLTGALLLRDGRTQWVEMRGSDHSGPTTDRIDDVDGQICKWVHIIYTPGRK